MTAEKWKKIRVIGRLNYTIRYGVCTWGVFLAGLSAFGLMVTSGKNVEIINLIFNCFMWLVGGYFLGAMTWDRNEKKYR